MVTKPIRRFPAFFLAMSLGAPPHAFALRDESVTEKKPEVLAGLETALRDPNAALKKVFNLDSPSATRPTPFLAAGLEGEGWFQPLPPEQAYDQMHRFLAAIRHGKQERQGHQRKGIVDLRGLPPEKKVIIVGDMHAFGGVLERVLRIEGMDDPNTILLLTGDAIHREDPKDWTEMDTSIGLMQRLVQGLKIRYPGRVHYILGNHDKPTLTVSRGSGERSVRLGEIYFRRMEGLYPKPLTEANGYTDLYREFLTESPILAIGDGWLFVHQGSILGATLQQVQDADLSTFVGPREQIEPIVRQAVDGGQGYSPGTIADFLEMMGLPQGARIVTSHFHRPIDWWHRKLMVNSGDPALVDKVHNIYAGYRSGHGRWGYARYQNGVLEIVKHTDGQLDGIERYPTPVAGLPAPSTENSTGAAQGGLEGVLSGEQAKERFGQIRQEYLAGAPIRQTSRRLSETMIALIRWVEGQAVENLKSKIPVRVELMDETTRVTAYPPGDRHLALHPAAQYAGQDYFVAATGSLGRQDDFVFGSDADFIVFPSNPESVAYAQALQQEMTEVLRKTLSDDALDFKVDERLTTTYNFQVPPDQAPESLLKAYLPVFDSSVGMILPAPSITSHALRDMVFISGDQDGFERLARIASPFLYPYDSSGAVTNPQGEETIRLLLDQLQAQIGKQWGSDHPDAFDLKENLLRPVQMLVWVVRAKKGISTPSVFQTLNRLESEGVNGSQELADAYEFFLRARNALHNVTRGKILLPFLGEDKGRILPRWQAQVAQEMGLDVPDFLEQFKRHAENIRSLVLSILSAAGLEGLTLQDLPQKVRSQVEEIAASLGAESLRVVDESNFQLLLEQARAAGEVIPFAQGSLFVPTTSMKRAGSATYVVSSDSRDAAQGNNWVDPSSLDSRLGFDFQKELRASIEGRSLYVLPYLHHPLGSPFAEAGVQMTDDLRVVLAVLQMSRVGRVALDRLAAQETFPVFIHSRGRPFGRPFLLHFLQDNKVFSHNLEYAGDTLGPKKLDLRLVNYRAMLTHGPTHDNPNRPYEAGKVAMVLHMGVVRVRDPVGQKEFFVGVIAPSSSGKTMMGLLPSSERYKIQLVADDLTALSLDGQGRLLASNPENGVFAVLTGSNDQTNPNLMAALRDPAAHPLFYGVAVHPATGQWWMRGMAPPASMEGWLDWNGKQVKGWDTAAETNARVVLPMRSIPNRSVSSGSDGVPLSAVLIGPGLPQLGPLIFQPETPGIGITIGFHWNLLAMREFLPFSERLLERRVRALLNQAKPVPVFIGNWQLTGWSAGPQNRFLLEWMMGRLKQEDNAQRTLLGWAPTPESLRHSGVLPAVEDNWFQVNPSAWRTAMDSWEDQMATLGFQSSDSLWQDTQRIAQAISAGLEGRRAAERDVRGFLRLLAEQAPRGMSPTVFGEGLQQRYPFLQDVLAGLESQNIFSDRGDLPGLLTELVSRDARFVVYAGMETEARAFARMAPQAGLEARIVTPQQGQPFARLILEILSQATGLEQGAIEALQGFQAFMAGLETLSLGA